MSGANRRAITAALGRLWRSPWTRTLVSVVFVAAIFGFLFPRFADYGEVWRSIRAMTWLEVTTLAAVAVWNLVSYWPLLVAVQPGLRLREAAVSNLASTAVANTLPGGGAVGVGVTVATQRSWGINAADIARASVVSGIWNNFVKLGLPVFAMLLVAVFGGGGAGFTTAAIVGMGFFVGAATALALVLRSPALAWRIGSGAEHVLVPLLERMHRRVKGGWGDRTRRFQIETVVLLRRRVLAITGWAVVSHLSLYLVLLVALRHLGVSERDVSWTEVLASFAVVRLLSAIPITPGGLGVVELGLTAALGSGLPDATRNQIAAAVLVYRALTWFVPIPLGVLAWVFWRSNRSWRRGPTTRLPYLNPSTVRMGES